MDSRTDLQQPVLDGGIRSINFFNGRLLSEPSNDRIELLINNGPRKTDVYIGRPHYTLGVRFGQTDLDIKGVNRELKAARSWVFAGGLHPPSTATVVRVNDDEVLMTDGPFAEGKEFLGGITIIDVPDLDAALGWAVRFARTTTLPVEVRPFNDARR